MNRYLSELPQLFWVLCQFQQLGVKGHWGSVFSGDRETDGCHVLFPQIQNGEQKAYVLKNKQLTGPTKGVIYLEIDVIFNAVSLNFGFFVLLKSSVSWKLLFLICREFLSPLIFSKPWCILENALGPPPGTPTLSAVAGGGCGSSVATACRPQQWKRMHVPLYTFIFYGNRSQDFETLAMITDWTAWKTCKHL